MNTIDKRYFVNREFTPEQTQAFALRFAGDVVRYYDTLDNAESAASYHEINGFNESPWQLMTRLESVLWLRNGRTHRIAYGADVRETKSDVQAAHWFGECVRHELECKGVV